MKILKKIFALSLIFYSLIFSSFSQSKNIDDKIISYFSTYLPKVEGFEVDEILKKNCSDFFESMKKNKIERAYKALLKGSILSNEKIIRQFVENTHDSLQKYGSFIDYKLNAAIAVDERIVRLEYVTYNEMLPIIWIYYWFKSASGWKIVDVNVSTDIKSLFIKQ